LIRLVPLRPYASRPRRALLQVLADAALLAWVVAWVEMARAVDHGVRGLARPGYAVQSGAGRLAGDLREAGQGVAGLPLVGHPLGAPLTSAGGQAGDVADAGRELGDRITAAALPAALVVLTLAVVPVILVWVTVRGRFALRAGACAALARRPGGDDLLALRALATRSPRQLAAVGADPVGRWRREEPDAVRMLAELELRLCGVRRRTPRPAAPR
jgi:hypothetical protein